MEKFILTEQMLKEARDYIPSAEKVGWVTKAAEQCIDRIEITDGDGGKLPDMYMANQDRKERLLMGALCGLYLGIEDDYDRMAGSHIFNQIQRMKSGTLRDKCFDLISDYLNLERRLTAQINALLTVQNDIVVRNQLATSEVMKELPGILDQLKTITDARA